MAPRTRALTIALWLATGTALAFAVANVALWIDSAADPNALDPSARADQLVALQRFGSRIQAALGPLTVFAGAAVLLLERRLTTARGAVRVAGVAVVLLSGMVALSLTEPLGLELTRAIVDGGPAEALWSRWRFWLAVHAGLAVSTLAAYVAALALPRLPPPAHVLAQSQRRLLLVLGSATFFEGYDRFIVALALPYIGRDIGAAESTLGWALFWIRVGALLSLPLAWLADRRGRRVVLLITVVAYTIATFATAFTTDVTGFALCQLLATVFLVAELSLAHVIIAEEFPADLRGFGLGVVGAFGSLGAGAAAMLFPLMQGTPLGWRGLYLIGIVPLVFVAYLRRALPETRRWTALRASGASHVRWRVLLTPPHVRPLIILVTASICAAASIGPAFSFFSYVATTQHGWEPSQVSIAILVGGGVGVLGWPLGGRMADAIGRRLTGSFALGGLAGAIVLLYRGPTAAIAAAFSLLVFSEACVTTVVAALATECFPTAIRSTAKAAVTNATIGGALLGLAAVGAFSVRLGGASTVIAALAALNGLALLLLWTVPETAGAELDTIAA